MLLEITVPDQFYSNQQSPLSVNAYVDLNINPDAIAAQDIKLFGALIGAAYGYGISPTVVDPVAKALNQTIAKAIKLGIDPYTELLPLNMTTVGNDLSFSAIL